MKRPLTMAELAALLRSLPDGPERSRIEGWYWAKAIDHYGEQLARWYRQEYEWLRAHRRASEIGGETAA